MTDDVKEQQEGSEFSAEEYRKYAWDMYVEYLMYKYYLKFCEDRGFEKGSDESFQPFHHQYFINDKEGRFEAFCAGVQYGLVCRRKSDT